MKELKQMPGVPLRNVIVWTLVVCLAVAMAPWMSGGQAPLAMLLSGGAVLLAMVLVWRQPEVRQLRRGPLVWLYAGLVGWAVLSLLWTANRYSTVVWVVVLVLAGLVFRLAYILAGETDGRVRLVQTYVASAGLFGLYGLWLYFTEPYDRLTGSFYWANPAAGYMIPAILIAMDHLWRTSKARWVWVGLFVVFGTVFALTDSRAAMLVLALVVAVYLMAQRLSKRHWITLVFSVLGVIALTIVCMQVRHIWQSGASTKTVGLRFAEALKGDSTSGSDRLQYLESAAAMWFDHPIGGVGAGAYGDVHPGYQQRVVSASTSAHNFYVQTWAELGSVGVGLLAWVLVLLVFGVLRGVRQVPDGAMPLALGLLGVMLHIGLDIDARYPAIVFLVAMLSGVLYVQWRSSRGAVSWRLPAVAAVLLMPLISLYQSDAWAQRARASQGDGNYDTAAEQFGESHNGVAYNPDVINAEGINLYTLAAGQRDPRQTAALALDRAQEAQREDPADGQHRQLRGRVLELSGDYVGAERAYHEALKLDPYNHPDYALDLAGVQQAEHHEDAAVATARAMLALYPQAVVDNRNYDETLRPTLANLWALVGNIELARGEVKTAQIAAEQALKLDKQNLRGRALLVQVQKREAAQ